MHIPVILKAPGVYPYAQIDEVFRCHIFVIYSSKHVMWVFNGLFCLGMCNKYPQDIF